MSNNIYNDPKKSLTLYELSDNLDFIIDLYNLNKMPKVLMLTGQKGIGKFTMVSHFLNYFYNKKSYDSENKIINKNSSFYKCYIEDAFPNIIYLPGDNFKNIKVEDIRNLKSQLAKSSMLNKERFIILDDVELFNINSLNALLKIIEEPSENNYFVLINNQSTTILETVRSRSLEIKVRLTNEKRIKIIEKLIENNNLESLIDYRVISLSPGNFISYNDILTIHKIKLEDEYLHNIEKILSLYKKYKDNNFINLALLLTNNYFLSLKEKKIENFDKIIEKKSFIISNINKFVLFNLNQNSLLNAINNKLSNE